MMALEWWRRSYFCHCAGGRFRKGQKMRMVDILNRSLLLRLVLWLAQEKTVDAS